MRFWVRVVIVTIWAAIVAVSSGVDALHAARPGQRELPAVKEYLPWEPGRSGRVLAASPSAWVFGLSPGANAQTGVPGLVTTARDGVVVIELVDGTCARFADLATITVHAAIRSWSAPPSAWSAPRACVISARTA